MMKRMRLKAERVGPEKLQKILDAWLYMRTSRDLKALLAVMATWSRRSPPPREFLSYLDLAKLVCQKVPSWAFLETELRVAIMEMHFKKPLLCPQRPPLIEAKNVAAIIMNGMARFRELRFPETLERVIKSDATLDSNTLRDFVATIHVCYDSDTIGGTVALAHEELRILSFVAPVQTSGVDSDLDILEACTGSFFVIVS